MEHTLNNKTTETAKAGDYYIVDYNSVHSYVSKDNQKLTVMNFLFYPDFVERTLTGYRNFDDILNTYALKFSYKTLKTSPTGKVFHDEDGVIGNIVNEIVNEYKQKNYGYLEYIRCKLVEIFIITMRKVGSISQRSDYSEEITSIINYVKSNYSQKIKLGEIAEKYNYSLSSISKKFKRETGQGFAKYLQRIRIEQSCRLLETTDLPINDIGEKVGYDDVKFFRQAFKETLKISPRSFRNLRNSK